MYIDSLSRKILRELCTNSNVSASDLAEKFQVSRYVITKHIELLENELGLQYTIEPNYSKLGIGDLHIIKIRFTKKPKEDALIKLFEKSRVAQMVATASGDYDAVIVTAAKDSDEYLKWETSLDFMLSAYGVALMSSTIGIMHLGFVPLTSERIEHLDLDENYKKILIELNKNSRIQINDLGKKVGMSGYLARYYLERMENEKLIKRYTAIVTKSPMKYEIAYFARYTVAEGVKERVATERKSMYWKELDEIPVVSEFQIMWSLSGADRSFTCANYDDYKAGLKSSVLLHNKIYSKDKPHVNVGTIEKVLKGHLPIRNMDTKANYDTSLWFDEMF